jgi:ectoine hydroxylase-related dioxygenase (phytanoyl-CoA dioxygenase family)
MTNRTCNEKLEHDGFAVVENIYTDVEAESLVKLIENADTGKPVFRKSPGVFAIRQFLKELPETFSIIFNRRLKSLINELFGPDYFVVKSIYFDKPGESNWFVSYHQDLTISASEKADVDGFGPWTVKQNQFAVQPPLSLLEDNFTIRIHLDDTTAENGALKVIPGSHRNGIVRTSIDSFSPAGETVCDVPSGGVMIMRPLLLHASGRTTNRKRRRVIHIEFSQQELPAPLRWSEYIHLNRS